MESIFNSSSDQRHKKDSGKKGRLIDMRVEGHHSNLIMSLELWKIGILLVRLAQALWK
jgi:hypothetical protein